MTSVLTQQISHKNYLYCSLHALLVFFLQNDLQSPSIHSAFSVHFEVVTSTHSWESPIRTATKRTATCRPWPVAWGQSALAHTRMMKPPQFWDMTNLKLRRVDIRSTMQRMAFSLLPPLLIELLLSVLALLSAQLTRHFDLALRCRRLSFLAVTTVLSPSRSPL
jgi:hypothetical protein